MDIITVANDGPQLAATNYWGTECDRAGKFYFTSNATCVRVLVPRSRTPEAREMATGRIAVLSIGPCADWGGKTAAHLMFDDGSNSPYCLFSGLSAFDVLPSEADDTRRDLTCAVYTLGADGSPCMAVVMPLRIRHTPIPNFEAWRD